MSEKLLNTIRNARDGSMVDIRTEQGIDSFPIDEIRQIVSKYVHMERQTRTVNIKENNYENTNNDSNTSN